MNGRAGGCHRFGTAVRARQAYDVVPRGEQLANDGRANESGRTGNEYAHGQASYRLVGSILALDSGPMSVAAITIGGDVSRCQHYDLDVESLGSRRPRPARA